MKIKRDHYLNQLISRKHNGLNLNAFDELL